MARDNPFWCDDCGTVASALSDLFDGAPSRVTWCPNCGRLEDENGTVTPRESKKVAGKIAKAAIDGLTTDGTHHKQYYLEEILELARGEEARFELWADYGWELGVAP